MTMGVRVCHVVHHYGKLSESFIPNALEELERAGAEGWVATLSVTNRSAFPFPTDDRLLVVRRGVVGRAWRHLRGTNSQRFGEIAAARLRPLEPGVVHGHFGWTGGSAAAVAGRLDVPLVTTFHGSDVTMIPVEGRGGTGWQGPPAHPYARLFERMDTAIAVSGFIADRLRALGYAKPIEIVPAGVRLDELPYRGEQPPDDHLRIAYLGRLVPVKGVDVLLRAFALVAAELPRVSLDIVGGGPERASLEQLAERLGLADQVVFHGPLPTRAEVLEVQRAAHVGVVPSRAMPNGQAEGSPVVTKEVQAIGLPLVATDTGGVAETIPPAHRPDLVGSDDPEAMAAAILRLLADRERREERSRSARAWFEEQFDTRTLARRTVSIYERVA